MIEEAIQKSIFSQQTEKSFVDKLLAKDDIERVRALMQKEDLTRAEMLELLYMCLGKESKLLNYGEWDRYVMLKYFVWVRSFVQVLEKFFDYTDFLKEKEKKGEMMISPRSEQLLQNNRRLLEHMVKFLVDLYLNIGRTSLSLNATGIIELLTSKFEIAYPQGIPNPNAPAPESQQIKKGIFRR